jgi:preprotein translocase subunit SecE
MTNWFQRAKTFLSEVQSEMKKCSFPSRDEVVGTTAVVLVTSFVFAIFLWVTDMAIIQAYQRILKLLGS